MTFNNTSDPPVVLVVVPPGTRRAEPLADALSANHPTWELELLWAGDPHLRPELGNGLEWSSPGSVPIPEIELVRVEPDALPWLIGLSGVRDLQRRGRTGIVMIAGAVAVLDDVSALLPNATDSARFVQRLLSPLVADGLAPGLGDLDTAGAYSTSVASFGPLASGVVQWLLDRLVDIDPVDIGRLFELATRWFCSDACADHRIGVSAWRWTVSDPALIDAPDFGVGRPWILDAMSTVTGRVSLNDMERAAAMQRAAPQLVGRTEAIRLPGALEPDRVLRKLARDTVDVVPRPWSEAREFREWVSAEYWDTLIEGRHDLQALFPHHRGVDAAAFERWAASASAKGHVPFMVDPATIGRNHRQFGRASQRIDGVDVVGYLGHQSGVSAVGRQMIELLSVAEIPHTALAYRRCPNPEIVSPPSFDTDARFATTLGFVNGDQFRLLRGDHPELFPPNGRVIGYWFWELSTLRGARPIDVTGVDEIWTATRFAASAFEEIGRVPVRVVPLPMREPMPSDRLRENFSVLADVGDRFVFGVVFDHLSVMSRKNPIGAVRAFREAFAPNSGPVLVIKTLNAQHRWREHERLIEAVGDRSDIRVWDEHLALADQFAFISSLDCLVSLHRSEGLGLHLAEAMWLDVPVIATRYSGNLDFMDDDCAVLIDAQMVNVTDGEGAYPTSATWAEPDQDLAVAAMRRLAVDVDAVSGLARAGRKRMLEQPSDTDVAAQIKGLLNLR